MDGTSLPHSSRGLGLILTLIAVIASCYQLILHHVGLFIVSCKLSHGADMQQSKMIEEQERWDYTSQSPPFVVVQNCLILLNQYQSLMFHTCYVFSIIS